VHQPNPGREDNRAVLCRLASGSQCHAPEEEEGQGERAQGKPERWPAILARHSGRESQRGGRAKMVHSVRMAGHSIVPAMLAVGQAPLQ
jgi:hypothetical protein